MLENVAVIAAGQRLERNAAGDPQTAPVITLLVSPDDAQKLTLASTQGRIQLALRNPLDTKQQDLASMRTNSLYKNVSAPMPVVRERHKRKTIELPPAADPYTVQVIRGNKSDLQKFDDKTDSQKF